MGILSDIRWLLSLSDDERNHVRRSYLRERAEARFLIAAAAAETAETKTSEERRSLLEASNAAKAELVKLFDDDERAEFEEELRRALDPK